MLICTQSLGAPAGSGQHQKLKLVAESQHLTVIETVYKQPWTLGQTLHCQAEEFGTTV